MAAEINAMPEPNPATDTRSVPGVASAGGAMQANDLADLYKEHYKESMNNFRFYGTLRAHIAWAPATITIAAIGFLWDRIDLTRVPFGNYPVAAIIVAILVLVFIANVHLQREQALCQLVANAAQAKWDQARRDKTTPICSYAQLEKQAKGEMRRAVKLRRWDMASVLLLVFFLVLLALTALFMQYHKPLTTTGVRADSVNSPPRPTSG